MPLWLTIAKCDTNDTRLMIKIVCCLSGLLILSVTSCESPAAALFSSFLSSFTGRAPSSWRGLDEISSRLREDRLQAWALVLQSHLLLNLQLLTKPVSNRARQGL